MKKIIIGSIIVIGLFAPQITQAQGTITYLSNLGQTTNGSSYVGNDSWLAAPFITGTNSDGYTLDSVQLAMTDASGNPSGFSVMIYGTSGVADAGLPGSSLGSLSGSTDPSTAGIYTYTPTSNLTLSPSTYYFIVLTAETAVANGAYGWSVTTPSPGYNTYHWGGEIALGHSSDGLNWDFTTDNVGQFAIDATPVPEPSVLGLLGLGGLLFLRHRRRAKSV